MPALLISLASNYLGEGSGTLGARGSQAGCAIPTLSEKRITDKLQVRVKMPYYKIPTKTTSTIATNT
jgi:hypothetical protein